MSTCTRTDPSLWVETKQAQYAKKATTTTTSLSSVHHSSDNNSIGDGNKKRSASAAADHHYNSTMSILSRVFNSNNNNNNDSHSHNNHNHNRHRQTYDSLSRQRTATTTTAKLSSGWNFPSFHGFVQFYTVVSTDLKVERPATLLVCLQLLGAFCLYGYGLCRCQWSRWTNTCCGWKCGWGGCVCRKGKKYSFLYYYCTTIFILLLKYDIPHSLGSHFKPPIAPCSPLFHPSSLSLITGQTIKNRNKNHPSHHPSTSYVTISSPTDKDRQCIRKGATSIIIVSILGLVVLACLEPSTPLLSFPVGPPPRSSIYADNDIVVHVHTFDQWVHRPVPQVTLTHPVNTPH